MEVCAKCNGTMKESVQIWEGFPEERKKERKLVHVGDDPF